ncbi:membrane protein DedA, SNARE-associated domain [Seinonella peptonophila]|uniref:Membrane protein DedA, SNARE-associated domain n=1 Tax=Seinonella peptonophila TaxID=112248 RepID=A0A1M4XB48_9BACL|nr:DedA family protein [Seinonella peptonophila]SHE90412.1 membrane protein DedA, SNARE-associated domain [Seinonella peptonophila]
MENSITQFMEEYGYFGIFLMIALENIFPPIPSELVLSFGGFMTVKSDLTITGVVIASTIGAVVGALLLYGLGRVLDVHRIERIVERWGYLLRLKKEDIHKANNWFHRYGTWTVFFCRMVPLIRSLISIPAGMSRMNLPLFLLFTTLGTLIWNLILVQLGAAFGSQWKTIISYMQIYSEVFYVLIAIFAIWGVIWFWRRER